MPAQDLNGQAIVTLAQNNLGGLANAVTPDTLLSFINEGKDELWAILKQTNEEFFVNPTQTSDNSQNNFFAPLLTNSRQYSLPVDCRDILFIEVIGPSGYERVQFTRKPILHPEFRDARTGATAFNAQGNSTPLSGIGEYYYDVIGKNTLLLAQFPEVAFTVTLWYVRNLPEITLNGVVDEIVFPFHKKIANYAAMKVIMLKEDAAAFQEYREGWRSDIVTVVQSAGRHSADANFVADFVGA